ncbi:MAG: serine hydrolase [Desulfobacteraceae bacterium]|nr:serine hydrolase [Desulfobacteraceae bacterium]
MKSNSMRSGQMAIALLVVLALTISGCGGGSGGSSSSSSGGPSPAPTPAPVVSFDSSSDVPVTAGNATNLLLSGTCTSVGRMVTVSATDKNSNSVTVVPSPVCQSSGGSQNEGTWEVSINLRNMADSTGSAKDIFLSAGQIDGAGNSGSATMRLNKSTGATICTSSELTAIENEITTALDGICPTTDTPFSLDVKAVDGSREFTYNCNISTMDTRYESASTSKWVAATVILYFMESTDNLDANNNLILTLDSHPWELIDASIWPITQGDPLYNMTLRQLLSFTSGLTQSVVCTDIDNPNGSFTGCITNIANANKNGMGAVPGTVFSYGSNHLQVAGLMAIEAYNRAHNISSATWQTLWSNFTSETGLFPKPDSDFDIPSESNPRLAGGMHWTGSHYLAFIEKYYQGQILSSAILSGQLLPLYQQQLSDQIGTAATSEAGGGNSPALKAILEDWHYGFGNWLECHANPFDCFSGVDSHSSPGLYGAYPFINFSNKFYGILARKGDSNTFRNGYDIFAQIRPLLEKWASRACS